MLTDTYIYVSIITPANLGSTAEHYTQSKTTPLYKKIRYCSHYNQQHIQRTFCYTMLITGARSRKKAGMKDQQIEAYLEVRSAEIHSVHIM